MTQINSKPSLDIAVVGAGVAGLSAAWLLASKHRVTLFEANDYPGGHTHTISVQEDAGAKTIPVDTGFIVYNEPNYPHLSALFKHLGVVTQPSEMSFGVSLDK
ncbi:MAG: FAD-dependent oxidoreductase, partial [Halothiobacillaceae bacterium]